MIKNSMIQKKSIDQKNDAWSNRQKVDFLALKMKNLPFEKIYNIKKFMISKNSPFENFINEKMTH
jgi:hypothetical protein